MKIFTPLCGILATLLLALNCLFLTQMKAQTIQIDSTFTSDGEIFPFLHQYPGLLTISNINGIELKTFRLKDKQNQIVIPTQDLSAGIYLVSLIGNRHLIDSQKLTIIK